MWVTQQHCSQAQEAAAELKGSRRGSSEHLHAAPPALPEEGLGPDCRPSMPRETAEFLSKSGFPQRQET